MGFFGFDMALWKDTCMRSVLLEFALLRLYSCSR